MNDHKFDAVFFDLDDTLFNSTLMSSTARRNAIRAICEAGIDLNEEEAYENLLKVVKKYGSNYEQHFNRFLEDIGFEPHPKLIAAAIVAYHSTKAALLRPFPGVILTLLTLMKVMKIGLISDGIKIKQWEKLAYLGIQHFFDVVVINESPVHWKPADIGFKTAMNRLELTDPKRIIFVGNKIETDIVGANKMGFVSILFDPQGKLKDSTFNGDEKPDYTVERFIDIAEIVGLEPIRWRF